MFEMGDFLRLETDLSFYSMQIRTRKKEYKSGGGVRKDTPIEGMGSYTRVEFVV
jgi:hypothetical protein